VDAPSVQARAVVFADGQFLLCTPLAYINSKA